jgi:hypothetical protein
MRRILAGTREDRAVLTVLCTALVLLLVSIVPIYAQEAEPEPTPAPTPTPSPTLSNDGIFGCRGQGANIANVGTLSAIGGVYVPVNDAAVTLNTGYLVYKECVLDAMARKIAENSTSEQARQVINASNNARGGNPQYVVNEYNEIKQQNNIIVVNMLQGADNVNSLCSAFRGSVRSTIARQYVLSTNQTSSPFTCTMPAEGASYWERLAALRDPRNNEYGAFRIMDELRQRTMAYNEFNQRQRWQRSGGFYDTTSSDEDPLNANIITPGSIVQGSLNQMVGSGFRQLENANEIDQVVGNLWGGLTTQLIADTRGLSGLTQTVNGQPSYIDRMVSQTSASVRQQAANTALSVIGAARQIETSYRQAKEGIATALSNSIEQLRAAENQCWALIIPKVQEAAGTGTQLNIATSTQFSQPIIDAQIAPLATSTIRDIRNSDAAIALLNELISSVSNSASQANQQQALLRLDTMVANRQLHTATDATNASTQRDNVASALTKLVEDTVKAWGDSTDPNVGWCNVNNQAVITKWLNEWRI